MKLTPFSLSLAEMTRQATPGNPQTFFPSDSCRPRARGIIGGNEARTLDVHMVSRYPTSGSSAGQRGLATYTRMLAEPLSKLVNLTILAEEWDGLETSSSEGASRYRVHRVWHEGATGLVPLFRGLLRRGDIPAVFHIQHEFLGYGHVASNGVLLPLLLLSRIRGCATVVTFHGLLTEHNIGTLQFGDYGFALPPGRLRRAMRIWVRAVGALSDAVVVHEGWQREALVDEYRLVASKVHRIPHGMPEATPEPAEGRRPEAARPMVLFFGYLAPYKGLEVLLEAAAGIESPDFELLIAGDVSPRARGHPEYEAYLRHIDALIAQTKGRARKIGFVPEEQVERLFRSVDLVVLPYTSVISSSGPLALAMAYGIPILATRKLLDEGALCAYDGTVEDLRRKLEQFLADPDLRQRAATELDGLRSERSWGRIAERLVGLYRNMTR